MTTLKNERFKIMSNMNRYQDNNLSVGNTATILGDDKNSGLYYDGTNLYIGGGVLVGATPISNITSGGGGSSFFISLITKNGQAQFVYPTDKISDYNIANFSFPEILKSLQEGCLVKRDQSGGFTKIKNPLNDPLKTVDESDLCIKAKNAKTAGTSIDTFRSNSLSMPIDSSTGNPAFNAGYEIKYENGDIKNYISYHNLTIYDILKSLQSGELTKVSNGQSTIVNPFSTNSNNKSDLCIKAKNAKTAGYTKNSSRKSFSIGILKFGNTAVLDSNSEQMMNFITDDGFFNTGYSEGESFSLIDILVSMQTGHLCNYRHGYLQNVNNPVIEQNLGSQPNPKFSRYLYDLDINARRLDNLTIHEIFDVLEQGEYQGRKIKVKSAYTAEKLEGS